MNGIRNEFSEVSDILRNSDTDIYNLRETKIDDTFPVAHLSVHGFKTHRADRNAYGGGIIAITRDDIPHRRRTDIEKSISHPIECMIFEFIIRKEKWWFSCIYNPFNKHKVICSNSIENIIDTANSEHVKTSFIAGDLNINLSCDQNRRALDDVLHVYYLKNIVTSPTCFKSVDKPTLLDVILTTRSVARRISDVLNTNTGLNEFHHLLGFSTRLQFPRNHRDITMTS